MFKVWVREKRESLNLTQRECAAGAGISQAGWNKYETDNTQPRRETVEKIASAFGIPVSEALAAAGFTGKTWVEPDAQLTEIVYSVHPAQRAALVQAVRAMAQALNATQQVAA